MLIPDLQRIVLEYAPVWRPRVEIPRTDDIYMSMSANPHAVDLLAKNLDKVDWSALSRNEAAVDILRYHPDSIVMHELVYNTNPLVFNVFDTLITYFCKNIRTCDIWQMSSLCAEFLKRHPDLIQPSFSRNTAAVDFLRENPQYIDWPRLSGNSAAIDILMANPDKIDFRGLSLNPAAVDILANYPEMLNRMDVYDWYFLNYNTNPDIINFLEANPDKINWRILCRHQPDAVQRLRKNMERIDWHELHYNYAATDFILEHPDKIEWNLLVQHPNIFRAMTVHEVFPFWN